MKDFPCQLGKIKLVNEKKAFLYRSGYSWGPHMSVPIIITSKRKKTTTPPTRGSLCEKRWKINRVGLLSWLKEISELTWLPKLRSFLPSHNSLYFFYYHFLGFNVRHFSATHKRSWPQVAKPSEKEGFEVPLK